MEIKKIHFICKEDVEVQEARDCLFDCKQHFMDSEYEAENFSGETQCYIYYNYEVTPYL